MATAFRAALVTFLVGSLSGCNLLIGITDLPDASTPDDGSMQDGTSPEAHVSGDATTDGSATAHDAARDAEGGKATAGDATSPTLDGARPPTDGALADGEAAETSLSDAETEGGPACISDCTQGNARCSAEGAQSCNLQPNGCSTWVTTMSCGPHQTCNVGDAGPACTCNGTVCTEMGSVCQDAQTIATCDLDTNGCLYVASTSSPCPSPQSCSGTAPNAMCSLTCTSSCSQGQASCVNGELATCTLGSNGCYAYSTPAACTGTHTTCTGAAGSAQCTCKADPVCTSASNTCANATTLATCAQDAQNCFYQASTSPCTTAVANAAPVCSGSICTFTCNSGFSGCSGECVNELTSNTNCGSCGHACTGGTVCLSGTCGCSTGLNCGGTCQAASTANSCGTACGTACPIPANGASLCNGSSCGISCTTGFTACNAECTIVASDGANCGRCNHSCSGGTCSGGSCGAFTLGTFEVAAGIALDATNAYTIGNGRVEQAAKNGGSAFALAEAAQAGVIASDGSFVYYAASDGSGHILRVPPSTSGMEGVSTVVANESAASDTIAPAGLATDGTNLYWVEQMALFTAPIGTLTPTPLTAATVTSGLVADTTGVYFFETQTLYKYTRASNSFQLLASTEDLGADPFTGGAAPMLALGGGNVCWISGPSTLWCASSSAASTPTSVVTDLAAVYAVAADSTNAYVTGQTSSGTNTLYTIPIGGSSFAPFTPTGDPGIWLAADPGNTGNVYWTTSNRSETLELIAKP